MLVAVEVQSLSDLSAAIRQRFEHFKSRGARACAISLPPHFAPQEISDADAARALANLLQPR